MTPRHDQVMAGTGRVLMLGAIVVLGAVCLAEAWAALAVVPLAHDVNLYLDAARRWVSGAGFYRPEQVAGPYQLPTDAVLYPPVALLLLVPFTVLPAVLWWAIPTAITAWVIWRHRPTSLGVVLILISLAIPTNWWLIVAGNPSMWATAALALGTLYGWPAVAVLIKPSLVPFALFGAWRRSWWFALAAGALVSLAFLPMWPDWLAVVLNARGSRSGLLYSAIDIPLMLIPLLAWATRTRRESASGLAGRWDGTRPAPAVPTGSDARGPG